MQRSGVAISPKPCLESPREGCGRRNLECADAGFAAVEEAMSDLFSCRADASSVQEIAELPISDIGESGEEETGEKVTRGCDDRRDHRGITHGGGKRP